MNILSIDWGEKRIGLAFADSLNVPLPLKPAIQKKLKERLLHIEKVIHDKSIDFLVVGYPINMDGTIGFKAKEVDQFIKTLDRRFRLPIERIDERLTSRIAEQGLKSYKKKVDNKSGIIDSNAACLILQDFLRNIQEF